MHICRAVWGEGSELWIWPKPRVTPLSLSGKGTSQEWGIVVAEGCCKIVPGQRWRTVKQASSGGWITWTCCSQTLLNNLHLIFYVNNQMYIHYTICYCKFSSNSITTYVIDLRTSSFSIDRNCVMHTWCAVRMYRSDYFLHLEGNYGKIAL